MSGMQATHVPYKGAGPAAADVVAGHLDFQFAGPVTVQGFIQTQRLRALAVTSARRSAWMPELPTVAELGYSGFEVVNWFGFLAPARTPTAIVDRLNRELRAVLAADATGEMITRDGSEIVASSPEAFGKFLRDDLAKWTRLAKAIGLKAD
jgi:tripartite-type tricarboxylate transporter receptor subunit TctC